MEDAIAESNLEVIEVAFTNDELERLIHQVNNRVCVDRIQGYTSSAWEKIRVKLIKAMLSNDAAKLGRMDREQQRV